MKNNTNKMISVLVAILALSSSLSAEGWVKYESNKPSVTTEQRAANKSYYNAVRESDLAIAKELGEKYDRSTQAELFVPEMLRLQKVARESLQKKYGINPMHHIYIVHDGMTSVL